MNVLSDIADERIHELANTFRDEHSNDAWLVAESLLRKYLNYEARMRWSEHGGKEMLEIMISMLKDLMERLDKDEVKAFLISSELDKMIFEKCIRQLSDEEWEKIKKVSG